MIWYVIPARKGSKGLPNKNRLLFDFTASTIKNVHHDVIVTTNDEYIIDKAQEYEFNVRRRPDELAQDTTSIKAVMFDVFWWYKLKADDIVVMLYLTYPQRKWLDITKGLEYFYSYEAKSMLCRKEWQGVHPCLAMFQMYNNKGKQLFYHNYYRRQDYPKVFEISHFIAIFKVGELDKLNYQLYNQDTIFMPIRSDVIDIDTIEDFKKYEQCDERT